MTERIRAVLRQHGKLAADIDTLSDDADLFAAGLTSHLIVNVMVALENEFEVEFPDRLLRRRHFESVNAIRSALEEVKAG